MTELVCSYYTVAGVFPAGPAGSPLDFADRVRACADAGYAGIGLHVRDFDRLTGQGVRASDLAAILRDHGMARVDLEFLRDWHLPGEAGAAARRDEDLFYRMAEAFGTATIFAGGDMVDTELPVDALLEPFAALCARAAAHGVSIAIEPCVGTSLDTFDKALHLIEQVGAANSGLLLDVYHMFRTGLDYDRLRDLDPRLILGVQIDDAAQDIQGTLMEDCIRHRLLPGEGAARPDRFAAAILAAGYRGPFSVEVVSSAQRRLPPDEAARITYEAARRTMDTAQALAAG